ncbi:leucine zipper protein 1 [Platysternon megacephalum]|uniref:Leucine zipper protein 1 n=1 Tax=Platysternon megacephalum TaxID=55544 RepID=A0A4D9DR74_9SAUR|nr:leucine zipper protein 1 [Platysternon megacephalum]
MGLVTQYCAVVFPYRGRRLYGRIHTHPINYDEICGKRGRGRVCLKNTDVVIFIIYSQTGTRVCLDSRLLEGEQQFPPFSAATVWFADGGEDVEALSFFIIACTLGLHLNVRKLPVVSGESGEITRVVLQQEFRVGLVPDIPGFKELRSWGFGAVFSICTALALEGRTILHRTLLREKLISVRN